MGRLSTSWTLLKASWAVLRQDKELLWMPILSFLASLIALASILGVGAGLLTATGIDMDTQGGNAAEIAWYATMYLALAFVAVYFHAATVGAAWQRLDGGDPTVGSALKEANKHLGKLFVWSIMLATVNLLLRILRKEGGSLGRIAAGIAGGAWNLATYFVVPNLMYSDEGVGGSLRSSVGLFKRRWGETLVGHTGLGMAMGLLTFLWILVGLAVAAALFVGLGPVGGYVGLGVLGLGVVVLLLVGSVLSAVYKTALYRYAVHGTTGASGFEDRTLAGAAY